MGLEPGITLLTKAYNNNFAVGEFNISNMEVLQAVMEAANSKESPVIIGISNGAVAYAGWGYIRRIVEAAVETSKVPVALHFDHAESFETIVKAIRNGFTSVMIDASRSQFQENIDVTKQIVKMAHSVNCSVEAEVGKVAGLEENIEVSFEEANKTKPGKAREFLNLLGLTI